MVVVTWRPGGNLVALETEVHEGAPGRPRHPGIQAQSKLGHSAIGHGVPMGRTWQDSMCVGLRAALAAASGVPHQPLPPCARSSGSVSHVTHGKP